MHPRIVAARARRDAAQEKLDQTIQSVQAKCKHAHVVETPFRDGWIGHDLPRRLCLDCGFEEEAWNWPGRVVEHHGDDPCTTRPTALNSEFVKRVSCDEFWRIRP